MKRLQPEKLQVEFYAGVTPVSPILPRRYTLTHSDITAELYLTIGADYALNKIGPMRDEVLAQWCTAGADANAGRGPRAGAGLSLGSGIGPLASLAVGPCVGPYVFEAFCLVGDNRMPHHVAQLRYKIFKRELPLALEAIRYGDRAFFQAHPKLNQAPIVVFFQSSYPDLNRIERFGAPGDYA